MASPVEAAIRSVVTKGVVTFAGFSRALKDQNRKHPFLIGIHTPVHDEHTITDLVILDASDMRACRRSPVSISRTASRPASMATGWRMPELSSGA